MPYAGNLPDDWPEKLPPEFYQALEELNRGAYFACHETLEELWIPEKRSVREIYQGVLQIAVGCYHLVERANWVGAVNKLEAGARRLERAGLAPAALEADTATSSLMEAGEAAPPAGPYGVDWSELVAAADRLQTHLRTLGRDQITRFDRTLLPQVTYQTNR